MTEPEAIKQDLSRDRRRALRTTLLVIVPVLLLVAADLLAEAMLRSNSAQNRAASLVGQTTDNRVDFTYRTASVGLLSRRVTLEDVRLVSGDSDGSDSTTTFEARVERLTVSGISPLSILRRRPRARRLNAQGVEGQVDFRRAAPDDTTGTWDLDQLLLGIQRRVGLGVIEFSRSDLQVTAEQRFNVFGASGRLLLDSVGVPVPRIEVDSIVASRLPLTVRALTVVADVGEFSQIDMGANAETGGLRSLLQRGHVYGLDWEAFFESRQLRIDSITVERGYVAVPLDSFPSDVSAGETPVPLVISSLRWDSVSVVLASENDENPIEISHTRGEIAPVASPRTATSRMAFSGRLGRTPLSAVITGLGGETWTMRLRTGSGPLEDLSALTEHLDFSLTTGELDSLWANLALTPEAATGEIRAVHTQATAVHDRGEDGDSLAVIEARTTDGLTAEPVFLFRESGRSNSRWGLLTATLMDGISGIFNP